MTKQVINIGAAPDDGTGDPLRTAFTKSRDNDNELYAFLGGDTLSQPAGAVLLGNGTGAISSYLTTAGRVLLGGGAGVTDDANLTWDATNKALMIQAAKVMTPGVRNLVLGETPVTAVTGIENVFLGYSAGSGATTESQNVSIGFNSMLFHTSGSECFALGSEALRQFNGSYHVAIGSRALYGAAFGSGAGTAGNIAIGREAIAFPSSGNYNTAVGYIAYTNASTGQRNVSIGYASSNLLTSGSDNVAIGNTASPLANAQNQIVLGATASGDADNQVFLGNGSITAWVPGAADVATLGRADREFQGLYLANGVNAVAGTTATINAATGRFRLAAAATSFTLTNSRIAAGDTVIGMPMQDDANNTRCNAVVPGAGSAVFHFDPAPAANMDVQFLIVKN